MRIVRSGKPAEAFVFFNSMERAVYIHCAQRRAVLVNSGEMRICVGMVGLHSCVVRLVNLFLCSVVRLSGHPSLLPLIIPAPLRRSDQCTLRSMIWSAIQCNDPTPFVASSIVGEEIPAYPGPRRLSIACWLAHSPGVPCRGLDRWDGNIRSCPEKAGMKFAF